MKSLVVLIGSHWLGDFGLQNPWVAENKGLHWCVMVGHVMTVTTVMGIICNLPLWAWATIFMSHLVIDSIKARWKWHGSLWLDQVLHHLVIAGLWLFL